MKRFVSIFMAIFMLLSLSTIFTSAADATSLADNLIVHYDFEGATLEEQLSDKATGGKSKENITTVNVKPGQFEVKNGLGITKSVPTNGAESYAYYSSGITANFDAAAATDATKSGADIVQGITTEYTIYVDFMVIGDGLAAGGSRDIFRISNTSSSHPLRILFTNHISGQKTAHLQTPSSGGAKAMQALACSTPDIEVFYIFAVTAKWNATSSKWEYKGHVSPDGGATFLDVYSAEIADAEKIFASATMLSLGNYNVKGAPEYRFDDVRVYNKALSNAELVSESKVTYKPAESSSSSSEATSATTEATTTEATTTEATTTEATTTAAEKSGCGSVVGFSSVALIALGAVTILKKRK